MFITFYYYYFKTKFNTTGFLKLLFLFIQAHFSLFEGVKKY